MNGDMQTLRRENLRRWVDVNGRPQEEKSLFSQLLDAGSFGEKVARRLEKQYGMGNMYLDTQPTESNAGVTDKTMLIAKHLSVLPDEKLDALALILGIKLK